MKKYYFPIVSSVILILSLIAFSDNLFTDLGQKSNKDPKFIVHGIFMLAWFGIFVAQTFFILRKNIPAHLKWGQRGMWVAIGVFISTLWVFIAVFKGLDAMPAFVKANRLFMLSFAVLILLAYRLRKNAEYHKRLILVACILILEPIIGRVSDKLMIEDWELFYLLIWHGFFLSLFIYDWISLKRLHRVSWLGLGWFYVVWVIASVW